MPSVTKSVARSSGGIRDLIASGNWSPEPGFTKKHAKIVIHDLDEFGEACVYDALRLANAAFESVGAVSARAEEHRSWAWQLISYYYAGYFAANALMRLAGYGCLNLSPIDCAEVNQQAVLYGVGGATDATKLSPGLFYSWIERSKTPIWHLSAISAKGGVHVQFWVGFLKFLDEVEHSVKSSSLPKLDRADCLHELADLVDGLKHSGTQNGAWLSEVRNAANYRLDYGIWFPYQDCTTDGVRASRILRETLNGALGLPRKAQQMEELERAVRLSGSLLLWLKESLFAMQSTSRGIKRKLIAEGALAFAASI